MNVGAKNDFVNAPGSVSTLVARSFFTIVVNELDSTNRDNELLRQIAAGDRAAFAEFYDRHSTLIFSVACKILRDNSEAEDVVQEVFLQIWEKAPKFDPHLGRAASWAAILTRNRAIDRVRASQRRAQLTEEAGTEHVEGIPAEVTANDAIHGREKASLVRLAMVELPVEQRQAIELAYFSGLTQDQIARQLQQPLGTIKARVRRGLLKLRDRLEGLP